MREKNLTAHYVYTRVCLFVSYEGAQEFKEEVRPPSHACLDHSERGSNLNSEWMLPPYKEKPKKEATELFIQIELTARGNVMENRQNCLIDMMV